jgi:ribosomal protein S18 acetylase RimI-like enzyme
VPPAFEAAAALGLTLRPMAAADLDFIALLYATTRSEEVAATGWPPAMQQAFLAQQNEAQHRHYREVHPDADWLIVEQAGEPIGRLYLDEREDEVRLIDISLLPVCRGAGLGTALIAGLMDHGRGRGKAVSLHVAKNNPAARRLYWRLGFRRIADEGALYELMAWRPQP